MEACLETGDWDEVERYAQAFADSTSTEPVPWSDFLIARGRVLAAFGQGRRDAKTQQELQLLLDEANRIGFHSAIPALKRAVYNTKDPT